MSRFAVPMPEAAPAASQPILAAVKERFEAVRNVFRLVSASPAALAVLTGLSGALGKALDVKTREAA